MYNLFSSFAHSREWFQCWQCCAESKTGRIIVVLRDVTGQAKYVYSQAITSQMCVNSPRIRVANLTYEEAHPSSSFFRARWYAQMRIDDTWDWRIVIRIHIRTHVYRKKFLTSIRRVCNPLCDLSEYFWYFRYQRVPRKRIYSSNLGIMRGIMDVTEKRDLSERVREVRALMRDECAIK